MSDFQERLDYIQRISANPETVYSLLFDHDDRATAIMATGLIEDVIALGIIHRFRNNPSDAQTTELFTGYGPLATFSARITLGHLLGVVISDARHDLHIIRKIRNDFAHVIAPIDFDHKEIADRCRSLKLQNKGNSEFERKAGNGPRGRFLRSTLSIFSLTLVSAQMHIQERKVLQEHKDEIQEAAKSAFAEVRKEALARLKPSSEK